MTNLFAAASTKAFALNGKGYRTDAETLAVLSTSIAGACSAQLKN